MAKYKCIRKLEIKKYSYSFKEGETYQGNKINDEWYIIDSIGVSVKEFNEYFKVCDNDKEIDIVTSE